MIYIERKQRRFLLLFGKTVETIIDLDELRSQNPQINGLHIGSRFQQIGGTGFRKVYVDLSILFEFLSLI